MTWLVVAAAGLAVAGPPGSLVGLGSTWMLLRRRQTSPTWFRSVLLVVLLELKAGMSPLGALQRTANVFPDHSELQRASRIGGVLGLGAAVEQCGGPVRSLVAHLARAQESGSSLSETVRLMLRSDIESERAKRLRRARGAPVRLMLPLALLVLPGLVLTFYAPALLDLLSGLAEPLT